MLQEPDPSVVTEPSAVDPSIWQRFRPLMMRLHFYAGLFVAPFILIAAFTGLLYALVPQIDAAVYRHELTVDTVGERRLPLAEQLTAARTAHPEGSVVSIRPPTTPTETTQINLAVDDVPPDYGRTVFVDPYTGQVRGALTTYGQWLPVRAWFDELHRNLHLGSVGRNYSELAASWVWVIAGAGLLLWLGQRGGRRLVVPETGATGRRRLLSWHGTLGVWTVAAVALLAVSGMTWSRFTGEKVSELRSALSWTTPEIDSALPGTGNPDLLYGADAALTAAHDAHLSNPIWMYPPAEPGHGWRVVENKRDWPTRYDAIVVDPDSGAVTSRLNFADWPIMAKLADWIVNAHMGVLFGVINQVALILVALAMIAGILLGYRMWWRRRPTGRLPKAPRVDALRALLPRDAAVVIVAVVGFGYFAPLFGVSLVAFVAVDLSLRWWRTRKRQAAPSVGQR